MDTKCSWCIQERGETPKMGESHGICARHRAAVLAEYGVNDAIEVARTFRDLRPVRNDDLDSFAERLEREDIDWRTFWTFVGIGIVAAAVVVVGILVMTL